MLSYMKILISFILVTYSSSAFALAELEYRSYLDKQLLCMAEAIYFESRGEPFTGQVAVAQVILQRVESKLFPNDACSVVHQGRLHKGGSPVKHKCEFSYWCDGRLEEVEDEGAYREAISVATLVSEGVRILSVKNALHYHAIYVRPYWADSYKRRAQIGRHVFYSRERISQ